MPLKLPFGQKNSKPAPKGKSGAPKAPPKAAGKPTPPKTTGKPASPGKSSSASKKPTHAQPEPAPLPPLINLSPERQLDVLGIFLTLIGFGLALGLFSSTRSEVTGSLLAGLNVFFGAGAYLLPVGLITFGGWLVMRKIERIPPVSIERVTGFFLLFLLVQTFLQAALEQGGRLGGWLYELLTQAFDVSGAWVILFAWLVMALVMAFDLTVPELVGKFRPFYAGLGKLVTLLLTALRGRLRSSHAAPEPAPTDDGYTPLVASAPPSEPTAPEIQPVLGQPVSAPVRQIAWNLPAARDLLEAGNAPTVNEEFVESRARLIEETLASFGAPAQVVEINRGPAVTQFGVEPLFVESRSGRTRVRVSKIASLSDDLALALAAPRIRIQAPVPGRNYMGIEVPNDEMTLVTLREILETESFLRSRKPLSFALGRDVSGLPTGADLAAMPHLLIAGTTGSGKSVCVNSILTCLLLYNTPDDLRLVLVDPKRVELTGYNGIPHLLSPVVVEMERVLSALQWMTREMDRRYHSFAQVGARNITDYNAKMKTQGQKKLPWLVIVIDELADLMMIAPDETEKSITRLAQLARATGIHMILATQRPSVDVVTGLIKANFPARIAFAVSSNTDSRVILDQPGAERLLGRGDMLYQSPEAPSPARLQGVFVSDHEIHRLVEFWRMQNTQAQPVTPGGPVDSLPTNAPLKQTPLFGGEDISAPTEQGDHLLSEAVDLVRREGRASVSMLQRKLRIGYTRAARLVDVMEEKKIIGPPQDATGVRPVLDYGPAAPPLEK